METHNFCPKSLPDLPLTADGKVDLTPDNYPSPEEVAAVRRAVEEHQVSVAFG